MSILPIITPELVSRVAHQTYRLRLDSDEDRAKFDALEPGKQRSRTMGYEPTVRAVLLAIGCHEPERKKPEPKDKAA